ncbi:MAG TPA: PilC/PilY family type IV pilus protein [Burkholderiaceae bacterium]
MTHRIDPISIPASSPLSRFWAVVAASLTVFLLALAILAPRAALAQVDLADQPASQPKVPNNLLLTLSVEYPTAVGVAYPYVPGAYTASTCANGGSSSRGTGMPYCNLTSSPYLGYFDPAKCYVYITSSSDPNAPYFKPYSAASTTTNSNSTTGYGCSSSNSVPLWSGNWLNWASMQTLDVFRWALTGGYRAVDTSSKTILQKAWASNQGSFGNPTSKHPNIDAPDKSTVNSTDISASTPFQASAGWAAVNTRIGRLGYVMWVTGNSPNLDEVASSPTSSTNPALGLNADKPGKAPTAMPVAYAGQNSYVDSDNDNYADPTQIYALQIRVQVCDTSVAVESNCKYYGATSTNYKPEGLIQQYAMSTRFGVMGYLLDSTDTRDGGVLRASMKFVGPMQPVIGSSDTANSLAEWSSTDGTFLTNPSPNDIVLSTTSPTPAATSGVINYLNGFGYTNYLYKGFDPVSELYYAGVRYFENVGPDGAPSGYSAATPTTSSAPVSWVSGTGAGSYSGNLAAGMADGFPVVTTWTDPILYSCQLNYILGIGDTNTHADANIPGSPLPSGDTNEVAPMPLDNVLSAVSYNGQTGVGAANSMLAALENLPGTTGLVPICCEGATYNIAGLAYYAHTNDLRPNDFKASDNLNTDGTKKYTQTINGTFWLDVQEHQSYTVNNQYYMATKWGSFAIPPGFQPWAKTNTNTKNVPQLTTTVGGTTIVSPMSVSSWYTNGSVQANLGSACDTTADGTNNGSSASCNWSPDAYFSALDARYMVDGLKAAFSKAGSGGTGYGTAFAAVSANITSTSGNVAYSSSYTPSPAWSGDVIGSSVTFDAAGNPSAKKIWNAASILNGDGTAATTDQMANLASNRVIVTCCQTGAPAANSSYTPASALAAGSWGLPFEAGDLAGTSFARTNYASFADVPNVARANQSKTNFLNYLRGDRSGEICVPSSTTQCSVTTGYYRTRTTLLGDIVDSQVTAVGPPSASYSSSTNPGYNAFSTQYAARKPVVYVGANDGMMHAFDGGSGSTGGSELFAYVPSFVYGCSSSRKCSSSSTPTASNPVISGVNGLASLGNPSFVHHYLVDSTPVVNDVDLNNTGGHLTTDGVVQSLTTASGYSPNWISLLVGGLGKGGHGYYALDVTDPGSWTSESAVAGKVLWEFTDSRMGDSYGSPVIVKTLQYGWVVILTSGYNNADGHGYFFIVDAKTGALLQAIDVGAAGASATKQTGLAHPTAYINDYTNYTADAVYAGDLLGNLWRLDLTSGDSAYTVTQIAALTDPKGNPQPVTTDPFPEQQPNTLNRYVFVGTGRLLGASDTSSTQIQTFYALIDGKTDVGAFYGGPAGSGQTLPPGVSFPVTRSNMMANTNLATGITFDTDKPMGWYFDLSTDPATGVAERVTVDPASFFGIIGFAANLPTGTTSATACSPGGTSRIFATTFATGKTALTDPNSASGTVPISWSTAVSGLVTQLQFNNINGSVFLDAGSNAGGRVSVQGSWVSNGHLHRVNWREVPTAD